MAYKSYLINPFETTHENKFFREVSQDLKERYKEADNLNILIGNLSCNGHQIDALFIKSGQISVIDFKNYGGNLTFSENNPWVIVTAKGKQVLVAGGNNIRNPYNQILAYRNSVNDFLRPAINSFLGPNRNDFNLRHISGIVLFQQDVQLKNKEQLPQNAPFFHISSRTNFLDLVNDINSSNLLLLDSEIEKILSVFNIQSDNLFDEAKNIDIQNNRELGVEDQRKFRLVNELIETENVDSIYKKTLGYHKILLGIETKREKNLERIGPLPFSKSLEDQSILVDFKLRDKYVEAIANDAGKDFKRQIRATLTFKFGIEILALLYQDFEPDTTSYTNFLKECDFELFTPDLLELEYPQDLIDELSLKITQSATLQEKENHLKNYLSPSEVTLTDNLELFFSKESTFNIQAISELEKLKTEDKKVVNTVFETILLKKVIEDNYATEIALPTLEITSLNESQKRALRASFQNKLTVIQGPPGTGKSQLITNLIANAIYNNQKVLFASKNNYAVDNVKERFDSILKEPFLLRLGSKKYLSDVLIPYLNSITARVANNSFPDKQLELGTKKIALQKLIFQISELEKKIERFSVLPVEIANAEILITDYNKKRDLFIDSLPEKQNLLFIKKGLKLKLDNSQLISLIHRVEKADTNFFSRFLFNTFSKRTLLDDIVDLENKIEEDIKEYINEEFRIYPYNKTTLKDIQKHLLLIQELQLSSKDILSKDEKFKTDISAQQEILASLSLEYKELINTIDHLSIELLEKKKAVVDESISALNLFINERVRNTSSAVIENYKEFVPDKMWKWEFTNPNKLFLQSFTAVAITNQSTKNCLPLEKELFDIVIFDEASQCDISTALPLIFRSKKVVVIGDDLQLKHITSVRDYEEDYLAHKLNIDTNVNYVKSSLFDYFNSVANKSNILTYVLDEHYRSHSKIIGFCSRQFYLPKKGIDLKIKSNDQNFVLGNPGVNWLNVEGITDEEYNLNRAEAKQAVNLSSTLHSKFPKATIGIISPFRDQFNLIDASLPKDIKTAAKAYTIHQMQGAEKDIIILSLVVSEKSKEGLNYFINNEAYLLNVGISRAKSALYILGNFNYCKDQINKWDKPTLLSILAKYVEENGSVQ